MFSPLLLSGPSGVGKSYLAKHLQLNYACKRIVPITTRTRRPGEIHKVDYYFLSDVEYQKLVENNELFMNNDLLGARYGFSNSSVDTILDAFLTPVSEIHTLKIKEFLKKYPDSNKIFLLPPSENFLEQRMRQRGETEETIRRRILEGKNEVQAYLDTGWTVYDKTYEVNTTNFKEIVKDVVRTFLPEGQIHEEGNKLIHAYALR